MPREGRGYNGRMSQAPTPDSPESWGAASRGYAEHVAPYLMNAFAGALVDRLDPDPAARVLEVGAGSGALTGALAGRVRSVRATDFAPQMIEVLGERMEAAGIDNVQCDVMDGQSLDVEDSSFDAGASAFALMLFPDRAKGFSELCRAVRPGGRVMVSAWSGARDVRRHGAVPRGRAEGLPRHAAASVPPPVFSLADPAAFKAEMETAGFGTSRSSRSPARWRSRPSRTCGPC